MVTAVRAEVVEADPGALVYRFHVTVVHDDEGWDHYADAWRVIAPDGSVLGERTLWHPHVEEQPFTRSLYPVRIERGTRRVTVEARDSVHGWGEAVVVELAEPPQE